MAKIGYIQLTNHSEDLEEDKKWMKDFGCTIIEESASMEKQRPAWLHMVKQLQRGDTLVVTRFSNAVRGLSELAVLFEYCRKEVIRIISIHDKIDSADSLFAAPRTSDFLTLIASIPEEISLMRKSKNAESRIRKIRRLKPIAKKTKDERNKAIVKLYLAGHPIDEIWRVSGFKSRSSVFRVLADNNIEFNRGHSKKELDARKENDNEND